MFLYCLRRRVVARWGVDLRLLKTVDALLLKLTVLLVLGACALGLLGAMTLRRFG